HIGLCAGEYFDLEGMIVLCLGNVHAAGFVAVAARADGTVEDDRRLGRLPPVAQSGDEVDRSNVDRSQPVGIEPKYFSPVEARPPCGGVEHEPDILAARDWQELLVVFDQLGAPVLTFEQNKRGKLGQ